MIKTIMKYLAYIFLFVFMSIYLAPKENLYFYLEKQLEKHHIVLSDEKLEEKAFGLNIKDTSIYYNKTSIAKINTINISSLVFNNTITIDKINVDDSFKAFIPTKFENININYSLVDPLNINIKGDTKLGLVNGTFNLLEQKLTLILNNSNKI